jgi:uncharacterized membrane protein YgcG
VKRRTPWWRILLLAGVVLVGAGAVGIGLIGSPRHAEKIDSLQVSISPSGPNGIRVREVIDQDFGTAQKHGPQVILPTDFGTPMFITASSTDAPDAVQTASVTEGDRVRIGDPDNTITGQHRYVLQYTLPDAQLGSGRFIVDAINPGDVPIDRLQVDVTGLTLADPACKYGPPGSTHDCELSDAGTGYRAVLDHVSKKDAVTVSGRITGRSSSDEPPIRPLPKRRQDEESPYVLITLLGGAATVVGIYFWARRAGSNEVAGGGAAADAAFGGPLPPGTPTQQVSDHDLAELSTIEFAPPPGITPWQGALAVREQVDEGARTAWFSGAAADGLIEISGSGSGATTTLAPGPKRSEADPVSAAIIDELFRGRSELHLGSYDSHFSTAWGQVADAQVEWAKASGWWRSHPPTQGGSSKRKSGCLGVVAAVVMLAVIAVVYVVVGVVIESVPLLWPLGLFLVAFAVPALVALAVFSWMLPARSATGSAAALRTESFRRFLVESEGQHVQWAWEHGLLRQYSAWAVALGAADAWRKAMESSGIPREEIDWSRTVLNGSMATAFMTASTVPSSSGSSSGFSSGGFSGGFSGGGGGGGSHGSW